MAICRSMRYRFAKSAHNGGNSHFRIALVAQLQHVGESGDLYETIDFLSVGFFASIFATELRRFAERLGRPPNFIIKRGFMTQIEARSTTAAQSQSVVAAVSCGTHGRDAVDQSQFSILPQGAIITLLSNGMRGYQVSRKTQDIGHWNLQKDAVSTYQKKNVFQLTAQRAEIFSSL